MNKPEKKLCRLALRMPRLQHGHGKPFDYLKSEVCDWLLQPEHQPVVRDVLFSLVASYGKSIIYRNGAWEGKNLGLKADDPQAVAMESRISGQTSFQDKIQEFEFHAERLGPDGLSNFPLHTMALNLGCSDAVATARIRKYTKYTVKGGVIVRKMEAPASPETTPRQDPPAITY